MKRTHKRHEKKAILKKLYNQLKETKNSIFEEDYQNIKRQIENIKFYF